MLTVLFFINHWNLWEKDSIPFHRLTDFVFQTAIEAGANGSLVDEITEAMDDEPV